MTVVTPSFQQMRRSNDLRQELIENGALVRDGNVYRFTQDYVFSSPSSASDMVLGTCSNGRLMWKDTRGRTLKELQAEEASV